MNQRQAVYNATMSALEEHGVAFEPGNDVATVISPTIRKTIHGLVVEGFRSGEVTFADTASNSEKMSNPSKLSSYVSGLISNWHRKDKRLNGNTTYVAKNPGSRSGSGDAQLRELKKLYKQFLPVDENRAKLVYDLIEKRTAEVSAEKAKAISIDTSVLPAELIEELGL